MNLLASEGIVKASSPAGEGSVWAFTTPSIVKTHYFTLPVMCTGNAHLFVYGSLRRGSRHPQATFLAANARWLGGADFQGLLFNIGAYPGAVASADPAHWIRGDLYRLADPVKMLAVLDGYEEFGADFPQPNEFIREQRQVSFGGRAVPAWIYLYNHSTRNLPLIEYDYFSTLRD